MITKGILLAGGRGNRLYPMTAIVSKQLQPVYNKPMIYYSLTTLIVAGMHEILLISTPEDLPHFQALLGDGQRLGVGIQYAAQAEPKGIAQALTIGAEFIADEGAMLMLGDNLIYGRLDFLRRAVLDTTDGATIFAHHVADPERFGVVTFSDGRATSLEEKPVNPRSSWAVPGMYVYGPGVVARARALKPSARGELEITDLNRTYLADGTLRVTKMGRGIAWFDTGTPDALLDASHFVQAIETRQGLIIGCPEEAAYRMGRCDLDAFEAAIQRLPPCPYRSYVARIAAEERSEAARG